MPKAKTIKQSEAWLCTTTPLYRVSFGIGAPTLQIGNCFDYYTGCGRWVFSTWTKILCASVLTKVVVLAFLGSRNHLSNKFIWSDTFKFSLVVFCKNCRISMGLSMHSMWIQWIQLELEIHLLVHCYAKLLMTQPFLRYITNNKQTNKGHFFYLYFLFKNGLI